MNNIQETFSMYSYETGGVLLGNEGLISSFIFDEGIQHCDVSYIPDIKQLNTQIQSKMNTGFQVFGFVHSHFERRTLSVADIIYAKKIMELNHVDHIRMFLYVIKDKTLFCYIVRKDTDLLEFHLETVPIKEI